MELVSDTSTRRNSGRIFKIFHMEFVSGGWSPSLQFAAGVFAGAFLLLLAIAVAVVLLLFPAAPFRHPFRTLLSEKTTAPVVAAKTVTGIPSALIN